MAAIRRPLASRCRPWRHRSVTGTSGHGTLKGPFMLAGSHRDPAAHRSGISGPEGGIPCPGFLPLGPSPFAPVSCGRRCAWQSLFPSPLRGRGKGTGCPINFILLRVGGSGTEGPYQALLYLPHPSSESRDRNRHLSRVPRGFLATGSQETTGSSRKVPHPPRERSGAASCPFPSRHGSSKLDPLCSARASSGLRIARGSV